MKYRCLINFKDLSNLSSGEGQYLLAGQEYKGKHADHFLSCGFIKKETEILETEAKKAEQDANSLLEQAKEKKKKAKEAKEESEKISQMDQKS